MPDTKQWESGAVDKKNSGSRAVARSRSGSAVLKPVGADEPAPAPEKPTERGDFQPFKPDVRSEVYEPDLGAQYYDRMVRAYIARLTGGVSPTALALAYTDWAVNLSLAPGKRFELTRNAAEAYARYAVFAGHVMAGRPSDPVIEPMPHDKRFLDERWQQPPFNLYMQAFLLTQQWWHNATTGIRGVSSHHEDIVSFVARQIVDAWSPSNTLTTNPRLIQATWEEGGQNLVRGWQNLLEDLQRRLIERRPKQSERYLPGKQVAATEGSVVFRNHLIELIQYAPATETVRPEPILIVPAWIMKYYILDLTPENSLISYLVSQGYTVFAISWRNPEAEDRDLTMGDYRRRGVMAALDAVNAIVPGRKVHAMGYCLGGTLLAITAAALTRNGNDRLATMTLLAAQTDFTEAGELMLFIDEGQLDFLQDLMWSQGFLDSRQMAGAFTLLRTNDLFWSRLLHDYFLGVRGDKNALMAWNADATRMPYRMHREYLDKLLHRNELAQAKYDVDGQSVSLTDLRVPIFAVGTSKDHVAPWRSVYKISLLTNTEVTFLLTSGGHNGGIVTPPGHPRRIYQVSTVHDHENYVDPDRWRLTTPVHQGSWWPEFVRWLDERSGAPVSPPPMGNEKAGYPPLCPAPGTYVLMT